MAGHGTNIQANRILNAMSPSDMALLQPHLGRVELKFRQRLQLANRPVTDLYFPESGIASVVAVGTKDRPQAEVALIGVEGMTGLPIVCGAGRSPCDVFMQVAGVGQSISVKSLLHVMDQSITMLKCFLRYAHVFAVQSGYTALANARGNVDERLARWLLMAHDRVETDDIGLTHEFIALMLGVRRAGVTVALQDLQRLGCVAVHRGSVTVLDRSRLHDAANGFYGIPEAEFDRLFPLADFIAAPLAPR